MKQLVTQWISSFNNSPVGMSARKLSGFWGIVIMASWVTFKYTTPENAVEVLIVWLLFGGFCLGLVTVQQIIDLRTGTPSKKEVNIDTGGSQVTLSETKNP